MGNRRCFAVAVLGMLVLTGGCLNLQVSEKQVRYYTLEYPVPEFPEGARLDAVLQVKRFAVAPTYNTRRMIYREGAFRRDAYVYSQWRDNPGDLVSFFLARDLRASGLFKAVIPAGGQVSATHVLEGGVEEFLEWDTESRWEAVLGATVTLTKTFEPDASEKVVFQKNYRLSAPCPEKNPEGLAAAMSEAMRSLSGNVISDLYEVLSQGRLSP